MEPPKSFETLKDVLLDAARQPDLSNFLATLVTGTVDDRPHVAHTAVWMAEGRSGAENPGRLRLAASAWDADHGPDKRRDEAIPELALVTADEPVIGAVLRDEKASMALGEATWPEGARPEWARREGLVTFLAEPIRSGDELLGAIAVFGDVPYDSADEQRIADGIGWLCLFSELAGALIANAKLRQEREQRLEHENEYLRQEYDEARGFGEIIGDSPALRECLEQVRLVAPTEASVLVTGESGTGKELIARAIHDESLRREQSLIRVNCASIPESLFESEFFGHVRGAFTGALKDRPGRFALAHEGTLFLDEVGEVPLDLQGKLLRVLQEGTYERVGDDRTRTVDVRVVAATNRDLEAEVRDGRFREDLYYRLNVFPIRVAPLRERREDIAPLAEHFLKTSARQLGIGRIDARLDGDQLARLESYLWPGNVRELRNVIQRAIIKARAGRFDVEIPGAAPVPELTPRASGAAEDARAVSAPAADGVMADGVMTDAEIRELERRNIERALEIAEGKIAGSGGAAERLGLNPATLASRIKSMKIARPGDSGD